ncbi:MAG: SDR family NAD(P)-dependent oxidoreductase [Ilumatobacteraceae bacterium]
MDLKPGQVAVVTGAASGIGFALANSFARRGLSVVLADVQQDALDRAAAAIGELGVATLAVPTDVRHAENLTALADATLARFGAVHVVCNNAGVSGAGDPWTGPLASWEWVMGVNFWGVVHGVRAFLPHLVMGGGGYIVNTASIAGLFPGFAAPYDASKHAVVALTEGLYNTLNQANLGVGVSCLCPGWVRTGIMEAERNWPADLGQMPVSDAGGEVVSKHVKRAIDEGMTPAAVADLVLDCVENDRFWVFPHQDFLDLTVNRWERIAERLNPEPPDETPGMPNRAALLAEVMLAMGMPPPG